MPINLRFAISPTRRLAIDISSNWKVEAALPEVDLASLAPPGLELRLLEPLGTNGNVSLYELYSLAALAKSRAPRRVFEFGTFNGRSLLNIVANAGRQLERASTLDLPRDMSRETALPIGEFDRAYIEKAVIGELLLRPEHSAHQARVEFLRGDSAAFDYSPWHGQIDFVFIDACHEYEYVLNDSARGLELARSGAIVLWHDYGVWPGVTRALNELSKSVHAFRGLRHVRGTTLAMLEVVR
jgi:predicted O-methyltransferase YrrM